MSMVRIIFELGIDLIESLIVVDFLTRYLGRTGGCGHILGLILSN